MGSIVNRLTGKKVDVFEYSLSTVEIKNLVKWWNKHHKKCDNDNPNNVVLSFAHTGIGIGVNVRCNNCNEENDITDYDIW